MPNRDINPNNELTPEINPSKHTTDQTLPPEAPPPAQYQEDVAQYVERVADDPSAVFDSLDDDPPERAVVPKDKIERSPEAEEQAEIVETREPSPLKKVSLPGANFLHERNPKLHASREVEDVVKYLRTNGEDIPNEPDVKITAYIGFLSAQVNDGMLTGEPASVERQVNAHVIKADEIPESYFDLQRRIARERGLGSIELTPSQRREHTAAIQADQKASLNNWAAYLSGEDANYPDWFTCYAWENITKLGRYDQEKEAFQKRSRGTAAPYPELNREALAYVHDALHKTRIQDEPIDDGKRGAELQKHLVSGNFAKLYARALSEVTTDLSELHEQTKGSWTTFRQSDDPEAARSLAHALQGYGTGWCTASEKIAHKQLKVGDFHLFRTQNQEGEDAVPRVAIRMEDDEVAEVRGIQANQELEPALIDITTQGLHTLPGGQEYIQRAEDMQRLTTIEQATLCHPNVQLSDADLRFLYEMDREIEGFGYSRDPRIREIRLRRNESDKSELVQLLSEDALIQAKLAFRGYEHMAAQLKGLGQGALDEHELVAALTAQNEKWHADGVYNYLAKQVAEDGGHFTLVATPNVGVSEKDILRVAEKLGKDRLLGEPDCSGIFYRDQTYVSRELSGNNGNAPVRFSLVSGNIDGEMSYNPANEQLQILRQRQAVHPRLNIHVPSILETLAYWYGLRAKYGRLENHRSLGGPYINIDGKSYVRHIDLEPRYVPQEGTATPMSRVTPDGKLHLIHMAIDNYSPVRLAIG